MIKVLHKQKETDDPDHAPGISFDAVQALLVDSVFHASYR